MLYPAAINYNQLIATKLGNELSILLNSHASLPEEWHIEGLADKFYDFPNIKSKSISSPGINIFNRPGDRSGYSGRNRHNKGGKQFELKKKIQCKCCKMPGHSIGE